MTTVPCVTYQPSAGNFVTIPIASVPFTGGLTTPQQVSVANPAVGFSTIYVNNSGQLSVTDSVGDVYKLAESPAAFDLDMNSHNIVNAASLGFTAGVTLTTADNLASTNIGFGNVSTAGHNAIMLGAQISASGSPSVSIGSGNAGIANNQNFSVAIGNDIVMAGPVNGGIAIGSGAGLGAVGNAIAIGTNCVNNTTNSCLIGGISLANIRANNTSFACDLGTAAEPFKSCWLRDAAPATGAKFVMNAPVSVTNTVAETSLLSGSSVGNLVYSAGQVPGATIRLKLGTALTVAVADTVTVRVKINGTTVVSQVLGGGVFAAAAGYISADLVIQAANLQCQMQSAQTGAAAAIAVADPAYNPAIANTVDVTAQWSAAAAGDTFTVNYCYLETLFAQ